LTIKGVGLTHIAVNIVTMNKLIVNHKIPSGKEKKMVKEIKQNFAISGVAIDFILKGIKWYPKINGKLIPIGLDSIKEAVIYSNSKLNIFMNKYK